MLYYSTKPKFERYFRPETIQEAVALLNKYGKDARILAGGTDLQNLMRNRSVTPNYIIDIGEIPQLDYISVDETGILRIGTLATLSDVEQSETIKKECPLLSEAMTSMGTPQLRNMGTVVGNLCRASPSADSASPLLALEASLEIAGTKGNRIVPLHEFFTGPGETALKNDEIVTEIRVPKLAAKTGTAFVKLARLAEDLAKVNVATVLTVQDSICKEARIALGGVAPTPIRANKAEAILKGNQLEDKLIDSAATAATNETKPITDVRSTAEYRLEVSKVLVTRALKMAWKRAQG